jgi:hypothetical protein
VTVIRGRAIGGTGEPGISERYLAGGDVARRIGGGVRRRDVSDALYDGRLDGERCPIVGGRRLIPEDYVEEIRRVLLDGRRQRKKLATAAAGQRLPSSGNGR